MATDYIVFRKCKDGQHDKCYKMEKSLGRTWMCICACHQKR